MSATEQKVVVLKSQKCDSLPREVPDRDFWIQTRRALLAQVDAIEKRLGIVRRCTRCGETLSS